MSTVSQICEQIRARLATLPDVDKSSIDLYFPPIETQRIALIIPPFGQQTQVHTLTSGRKQIFQSHRIRCEFWIKLDAGKLALCLQRAREIGQEAARLLIVEPGLSGTTSHVGHYGPGGSAPMITAEVADQAAEVGNASYLVCVMTVPVIDYDEDDL